MAIKNNWAIIFFLGSGVQKEEKSLRLVWSPLEMQSSLSLARDKGKQF